MQKQGLQLFSMLVLLAIVTAFNYNFFTSLGMTGVTLSNLLVVVTAAYFCEFFVALMTAFLAFLAINYFFTEPLYTFQIAHVESWTSLICFLIVSIVIASLVKQLKFQTEQAEIAKKHAQFARSLAENLALATDVKQLLQDTCSLLHTEFDKPFAVVAYDENKKFHLTVQSGAIGAPDERLLKWVMQNGKPISPYTNYWTESVTQSHEWLLPFNRLTNFNRLAGEDPILVVGNENADENIEVFNAIKSCVDQISQAYQRLMNSEKASQAELIAKTDAIQNALLASISHDMRTPLTSILGAATTMQQDHLAPEQYTQLSALIASQARYLANTTENILSLIRLEASFDKEIPMDWQSPEELIGIVSTLYKNRNEAIDLKVNCDTPDLLIKGNANLITQALVNLIENAKQANVNNAPIEIDVSKINNRIYISVNDRGIGFTKDFNAAKIKKFSSSHNKGFGLGLSIVQAIAQAHHAILTIENRLGGGVSATLSFPAPDLGELYV
jgi:two-component system sensor histidine kinase KdpD